MQRRPLGHSGLDVPVIGMGTWRTFDVGRGVAEQGRRAVLDAAFDAGATLFDTSPMYGEAEAVLARAIGARRAHCLVADKLWTADDAEADAQVARALAWYGGRVDVYQVHNLVALDARLRTLHRLREAGQVGAVGVTHYQHAAFPELVRVIRSGQVDMVQIPYNAADDTAARAVLPAAADHGVGVLVMRPLGEGRVARQRVSEAELAPLTAFGITSWAQALLAWIVADERVSCAIPATTRPERMRENAAVGAMPLLDADARALVGRLARRR